jgi:hypothetical protein
MVGFTALQPYGNSARRLRPAADLPAAPAPADSGDGGAEGDLTRHTSRGGTRQCRFADEGSEETTGSGHGNGEHAAAAAAGVASRAAACGVVGGACDGHGLSRDGSEDTYADAGSSDELMGDRYDEERYDDDDEEEDDDDSDLELTI